MTGDIVEKLRKLVGTEESSLEGDNVKSKKVSLDDRKTHEVYIDENGLFNFPSDETRVPVEDLSDTNTKVIEALVTAYNDGKVDNYGFIEQLNNSMNIMHIKYKSSGRDHIAEAPKKAFDRNGNINARKFEIPLPEYLSYLSDDQLTQFAQIENELYLGHVNLTEYFNVYNALLNAALKNKINK